MGRKRQKIRCGIEAEGGDSSVCLCYEEIEVIFDFNKAKYTNSDEVYVTSFQLDMLKNYFDIIKKYVYNIKIDSEQEDLCMTISEQIKVLCVRCGVSEAELARRLGKSPQSFNSKMKRESFTVEDLDNIADALGVEFNREFILANGDKV